MRIPFMIRIAAVWREAGEAMRGRCMSRSEMLELAESMEGAARALRSEAGKRSAGNERIAATQ